MEGITDATAGGLLTASLRAVDTSPQSQTNARISAQLATTPPSSTSAVEKLERSDEECERIRMDFRSRLMRKYHSMVAAWKQIDPQSHGRLSFYDFCRACRHLGCDGDARVLWEALDANGDGFISLDEVDPNLSNLLESFSQCVNHRCGTADGAWNEHFNKNGFGRCPPERFFKACEKLGFRGDTGDVYNALDVDGAATGIAFEDFQLLDRWFKSTNNGRWSYGQLRPVIKPK